VIMRNENSDKAHAILSNITTMEKTSPGIIALGDMSDRSAKSTLSRVNHILNSVDDPSDRQSIDIPLRSDLKTRATSDLIMDIPLPKRKNIYSVLFKFSDEKLNEQASQEARLNLKL